MWPGVTPNRSHPAICSAPPRRTKAALADTHTRADSSSPRAVFCKYELAINSQQADRYGPTVLPRRRGYLRPRTCQPGRQASQTRARDADERTLEDTEMLLVLAILEGGSVHSRALKAGHARINM